MRLMKQIHKAEYFQCCKTQAFAVMLCLDTCPESSNHKMMYLLFKKLITPWDSFGKIQVKAQYLTGSFDEETRKGEGGNWNEKLK